MCDSLKKEIDNFDEANKGEAHAEAHHAAQVGYQGVQGHHLVVRIQVRIFTPMNILYM